MNSSGKANLEPNSISWVGQFFQSMAHIAPAVGVIMTVPYMASRSGPAVPLATLFATLLALLLAYCLALLTMKYRGASGYFQIHSRALGSSVGFVTSWLFLMYEPFVAAVTFFGYGVLVLEPFTKAAFGVAVPWWAGLIVGQGLVLVLALSNVKSAIRATAFLGLFEFLVMLALGACLIWQSGGGFHPEYFQVRKSPDGVGGLLFSFIFGFMMFVGFESGLPLTEETAAAKQAMFRSLMASVLVAGLFYTFLSYATVVGFGGSEDPAGFAAAFSGADNPYGGTLAVKAFGVFGPWVIFLAATNSTIACGLASQNASIRVFFALGRAGILPRALGVTNDAHVPIRSTVLAFLVSLATAALVAVLCRLTAASDLFGFFGVLLTLPLLVIHLMTCVSVFVAYRFRGAGTFRVVRHAVIPGVTGLMVLLPIWGAVYYNPTAPYIYAPWIVLLWLLFGLFVYAFLKARNPGAIAALENEMGSMTLDGPQL